MEKIYITAVGGGIGPSFLHSAVNLLHKSISKPLQLCKEDHSLELFSDMRGMWEFYIGLHP